MINEYIGDDLCVQGDHFDMGGKCTACGRPTPSAPPAGDPQLPIEVNYRDGITEWIPGEPPSDEARCATCGCNGKHLHANEGEAQFGMSAIETSNEPAIRQTIIAKLVPNLREAQFDAKQFVDDFWESAGDYAGDRELAAAAYKAGRTTSNEQERALRELVAKWRKKTAEYSVWDDAADELESALATPERGTK